MGSIPTRVRDFSLSLGVAYEVPDTVDQRRFFIHHMLTVAMASLELFPHIWKIIVFLSNSGNKEALRQDWIRSCLLKHFTRKIKISVNRRFDVSNIILKIEVVYANVKVVKRGLKILNI